jgi:hypothetical protein
MKKRKQLMQLMMDMNMSIMMKKRLVLQQLVQLLLLLHLLQSLLLQALFSRKRMIPRLMYPHMERVKQILEMHILPPMVQAMEPVLQPAPAIPLSMVMEHPPSRRLRLEINLLTHHHTA